MIGIRSILFRGPVLVLGNDRIFDISTLRVSLYKRAFYSFQTGEKYSNRSS